MEAPCASCTKNSLRNLKPIHIRWGIALGLLLVLGYAITNVRDILWLLGQTEPPAFWQEWATLATAISGAILGASAVIVGIWRWVLNPTIKRAEAWFELQWEEQRQSTKAATEDRKRLEAVMKAVEANIISDGNGSDNELPFELRGKPLRKLVIKLHSTLADHLAVSEPLMEQFKKEHEES